MRSTLRMALRDPEHIGPRTSRAIAGLLVAGLVAAVGGVGYAINGATPVPATITVPISQEFDDGGSAAVRGPAEAFLHGTQISADTAGLA